MLKILTKEEFERRTADGARTPVFREYLADRETPVSVLTRVADAPGDVFLLESVYNGERKGRYSYLGLGAADAPRAGGNTSRTSRYPTSSRASRAATRRALRRPRSSRSSRSSCSTP